MSLLRTDYYIKHFITHFIEVQRRNNLISLVHTLVFLVTLRMFNAYSILFMKTSFFFYNVIFNLLFIEYLVVLMMQ